MLQQSHVLFLKGRCRPYGETTALYPVAGMFRRYFGISDHDGFRTIRRIIKANIEHQDLIVRLEKIFELFGDNRNEDPAQIRF